MLGGASGRREPKVELARSGAESLLRHRQRKETATVGLEPDDEAKVLNGVLAVLKVGFKVSEADRLASVASEDVIEGDVSQMRREARAAHMVVEGSGEGDMGRE